MFSSITTRRQGGSNTDTVLYADVLFLIDFSMDYLSLFAAAKLLSLPTTLPRCVLASAVGGLYGIVAVLFLPGGFFGAIFAVFVSMLLSVIAFGLEGGLRSLLRTTLTVWGAGTLLGGIMTAFSGLFGGSLSVGGGDMLLAGGIALVGCIRFARRRLAGGYAEIVISREGRTWQGRALVDSGNLLTDPIGGYPVVLLSLPAARELLGTLADTVFKGEPAEVSVGVRAVAVRTVGGTRLIYGFLCRDLTIRRGGREVHRCAVVSVDHGADGASGYGGAPALLPASLLF